MTDHPPGPGTIAEGQLADLVEQLTERLQAGENVDVSAVLAAHPEHAERLARLLPTLGAAAALAAPPGPVHEPVGPPPNEELGDFRRIREVGRGGMGVVYEAEQRSLRRRVALKVLPYAATMDPKQLQRFRTEAHAAAHLHHQNIVPVYAVGCERGVHYYAMQLIDGQSLADAIASLRRQAGLPNVDPHDRTASLPPAAAADVAPATRPTHTPPTHRPVRGLEHCRACARLGVQAAEALEHAHQMGVIHRDIKPANLLVDDRRHLWVTDFGLARCNDDRGLTRTGDLVGTLRYMSPEQIDGRPELVDERTDVYALGATLYELLTLEPLFMARDRQSLLSRVLRDEPRPPRRLNPAVPAELETVVLKALAKAPDERYRTAQELADDLRRFLDDRPIAARRPGIALRLRRWVRRHRPVVATAAASFVLLLILAVAGLAVSNALLKREGERTRQAERDQATQLALTYIKEAEARRASGLAGRRVESLDLVRKAAAIFGDLGLIESRRQELRTQAIASLALADVRLVREWDGHPPGWSGPTFDADLRIYLRRDPQGIVSLRRVEDDQELQKFPASGGILLSPDGSVVAVQCAPDHHFRLWDWQRGRNVFETTFPIEAMTFSPDGGRVALGRKDGMITIYDTVTGQPESESIETKVSPIHLSYSADGSRLAVASFADRQVQIRDTSTGRLYDTIPVPQGACSVAWHPDGVLLA
ncbi:MAG TPA: serine/threonine-protein kinase, partial [Gemmataceae bacterium]|nr:serine/threonine-protein kinase [Gemmataceae bacterium]